MKRKYIDADNLRAEIEKRLQENADKALLFGATFAGRTAEDNEIVNLIDSLQQEQPVDGLEEEIKRYGKEEMPVVLESDLNNIARHFAEWGEKNAYKAIMKKADEVRDKRFDTDYEVKIEPAAGFDWDCVNVYHEGKLVGQYVKPKEEKKLPESLDEAAEEYEEEYGKYLYGLSTAFKSGAEWMAAQGVNYELEVKTDAGGYPYIDKTFELYDYTEDKPIFNPGDKVIVNIRKKEDEK